MIVLNVVFEVVVVVAMYVAANYFYFDLLFYPYFDLNVDPSSTTTTTTTTMTMLAAGFGFDFRGYGFYKIVVVSMLMFDDLDKADDDDMD